MTIEELEALNPEITNAVEAEAKRIRRDHRLELNSGDWVRAARFSTFTEYALDQKNSLPGVTGDYYKTYCANWVYERRYTWLGEY